MARVCPISNRKAMFGNNVSHANNKTRRKFSPNLQNVRLKSDTLNETFAMRLSTRGIRTVDFHEGLDGYLLTTKNSKLHPDLLKIKKRIKKTKAQ